MLASGSVRTIDEYIAQFSAEIQLKLQEIRRTIRDAAPDASEKISWAMPTYHLHRNLVHFAAHKNHIGFYPGISGIEAFREELSGYASTKGGVQFPYAKPLPTDLIARIVRFRTAENIQEAEARKKK